MNSFGILTLQFEQERDYHESIARTLLHYDIDVYRFCPRSIDPFTEKVHGQWYDRISSDWIEKEFSIPELLYDRCFYPDRRTYKMNAPIVEWLKHKTDFLGYGLPGKWKVYRCLYKDRAIRPYLIPTRKANQAQSIVRTLQKRQRALLLKPEHSSQGKGIFILLNEKSSFTVKTDGKNGARVRSFSNEDELITWLSTRLARSSYLVQPYLSLQNQYGEPYDIRLFLEKNENGVWQEAARGIRVGKKGSVTSNLFHGGQYASYKTWELSLPSDRRQILHSELSFLAEKIPPLLESAFGPLVELGLDIGIDRKGAIWLLETNSKPGHGVFRKTAKEKTPLPYVHKWLRKEIET